jgi:flagellar protein FliO/FliZ
MNFEFLGMLIQLILALAVTLGLMFLSFRLVGAKLSNIDSKKYIKIIERVQVTKENAIVVVKIGQKGYIITSTSGHMEKLSELSEEEISIIEENKKKVAKEMTESYNKLELKLKKNISYIINNIKSKEDKHEKK